MDDGRWNKEVRLKGDRRGEGRYRRFISACSGFLSQHMESMTAQLPREGIESRGDISLACFTERFKVGVEHCSVSRKLELTVLCGDRDQAPSWMTLAKNGALHPGLPHRSDTYGYMIKA